MDRTLRRQSDEGMTAGVAPGLFGSRTILLEGSSFSEKRVMASEPMSEASLAERTDSCGGSGSRL